ncbi:MAG: SWIM zinc finger family protein [Candidatus Dormibacteria bacterium]
MSPREWDEWSRQPRRAPIGPSRRGARFGVTWWGGAWVEALEQRARLDRNRLPRGRTYARGGAVGELQILPGEVRALVQGSRVRPYTVSLRVREFTPAEWDRVTAAIAGRASHAAALLDGTLDPGIVAELDQLGVSLLPAAGELGPTCSCPDWANPCKHAAAVCYLVADRMDQDPFTIFLLRGHDREQVLAGVRARRSRPPEGVGPTVGQKAEELDAGVEARVAFQPSRAGTPLPSGLPSPERPGRPPGVMVSDEVRVTPEGLAWLAGDAAERAFQLSRGRGDGGLSLPQFDDLARIASGHIGRSDFDAFARRSGMAPRVLMRLALAWRAAGSAALDVLEQPLGRAPVETLAAGGRAMALLPGPSSQRGDRITNQQLGVQLRYGPDGLWYLLVRRGGVWEIHDPPASDPRDLVGPLAAPVGDAPALELARVDSLADELDDEEEEDEW